MDFEHIEWQPSCFNTSEVKDALLQWNLNESLTINRFRYVGANLGSSSDYINVVSEFTKWVASYGIMGINGVLGEHVNCEELKITMLSMDMFNKLQDVGAVSPTGLIRGCFEEVYDGVTVNDLLRDLLVNPDSENAATFSLAEKSELLYQLFRILVVGGTLCQTDVDMKRYLDITKKLYKDLLTVFKNSTTNQPEIAGKAFLIKSADGVDLFSGINGRTTDSTENVLIMIIDPAIKQITVIKKVMTPFW